MDSSSSECEITTSEDEEDEVPDNPSPTSDSKSAENNSTVIKDQLTCSNLVNSDGNETKKPPANPAGPSLLNQLKKGVLVQRDEDIQVISYVVYAMNGAGACWRWIFFARHGNFPQFTICSVTWIISILVTQTTGLLKQSKSGELRCISFMRRL